MGFLGTRQLGWPALTAVWANRRQLRWLEMRHRLVQYVSGSMGALDGALVDPNVTSATYCLLSKVMGLNLAKNLHQVQVASCSGFSEVASSSPVAKS